MTNIRPLADRVVIKELDESDLDISTTSGIIIPDTVDKDRGAKKGKVMAVGEGRVEDGKVIPVKVSPGDKVLFQWGYKLKISGGEYYIVRESEIIAVVK